VSIKPRLQYTFIPTNHVSNLPTIDPSDWWSRPNTITYSLNHYLTPCPKQRGEGVSLLEVEQTYISPVTCLRRPVLRLGHKLSDIHVRLTMVPLPRFFRQRKFHRCFMERDSGPPGIHSRMFSPVAFHHFRRPTSPRTDQRDVVVPGRKVSGLRRQDAHTPIR